MAKTYPIGLSKHRGEEHAHTLIAANNCASSLLDLQRFEEAKSLLREMIPVARRVLGESDVTTLRMRGGYAEALKIDPGATLNDLREAAMTLEDAERIARRVLGSTHPTSLAIEEGLGYARATLRAREAAPPGSA